MDQNYLGPGRLGHAVACLDSGARPLSTVVSMSDSRARGPRFDTESGHILSLLPLTQEGQLSVAD